MLLHTNFEADNNMFFYDENKAAMKSWENPSCKLKFCISLSRKSHAHFHNKFLVESFEETTFF